MQPDAFDLDIPPAPISSPPDDLDRPGVGRSAWRGAKVGMRWMAYIAGPIAAVIEFLSLALTAFAAGSGRGWGLSNLAVQAVRFFLIWEALAALLGGSIGLMLGLARRSGSKDRPPGWLARASRPLRWPGRRRDAEAGGRSLAGPSWPLVLGGLGALATLGVYGAGAYVGRQLDRRLDAALAAADRDDPAWRVDDLMAAREAVPDAENSALVAAEVLGLLPGGWPKGPGNVLGPLADAVNRLHKGPANRRLDDATADRLRDELEWHPDAVRLARTLAGYRRGRHELILGPTLLDTRLPETQASRDVARLLDVDAAIRAQDGDPDGSLDSCRAIVGVARSIGDEPFLISQLVYIAEGAVAMEAARRALAQGEPSDEALARLQALALEELAAPLMLRGLKGERATLDEIIRRIGAGEMPISALSDGGPPFDPDAPPTPIAPWGRLMFDHQRAIGLEWTTRLIAIARRPDPERPALVAAWEAERDRAQASRLGLWNATLPLLLMPAAGVALQAEARYHAQLGAMAILLAAERHRRKLGDWPASVDAIDRAILPLAPADPFTGQPFRMARRDGQLLVYSLGPNRQDDQGVVDKGHGMKKSGPDDYGTGAWDVPLRHLTPEPVAEEP